MLELLKQGAADRAMRLKAAHGTLPVTADENMSILVRLLADEDAEVRSTAADTLDRMPAAVVDTLLTRTDIPDEVRDLFIERRNADSGAPLTIVDHESADETGETSDALSTADPSNDSVLVAEEGVDRETVQQKLTQMNIPDRVKAAVKGSREVRAILIRDPNRMISSAVLTSPKLSESEVESFARMGNVAEDVLRVIGSNRVWMKNYGIMSALVKNSKTPLAMSLNLMHRLNNRDLVKLSFDRNVMEPLRVAAKRRVDNAKG
jgi:hypothetical protein